MKRKIRNLIIVMILLFNVINAYGMNVSILILQKDGAEKISESSRVFENHILNTLFDNGHIVSNEPISLYKDYEMAVYNGFNSAVEGFMDYFVEITLEYDLTKSKNPDGVSLENIKNVQYTIKKVSTGSEIYKSGEILPNRESVSNQYVGFNNFALEIADKINLNLNGK